MGLEAQALGQRIKGQAGAAVDLLDLEDVGQALNGGLDVFGWEADLLGPGQGAASPSPLSGSVRKM